MSGDQDADQHSLHCMEIWGGIEPVERAFRPLASISGSSAGLFMARSRAATCITSRSAAAE